MRTGPINTRAVAELAGAPPVKRKAQTVGDRVRDDARNLAPVLTGTLRRSLTVVAVYNPKIRATEYRVGWDPSIAVYGPAVEFGTEDTQPQPHLRPAANKVKGL